MRNKTRGQLYNWNVPFPHLYFSSKVLQKKRITIILRSVNPNLQVATNLKFVLSKDSTVDFWYTNRSLNLYSKFFRNRTLDGFIL